MHCCDFLITICPLMLFQMPVITNLAPSLYMVILQMGIPNVYYNHKVDILPLTDIGVKKICQRLIGGGDTFCTKEGCTTNHRESRNLVDVKAGDVVVLKSPKVGFCDLVTTLSKLSKAIFGEWQDLSATFEEWNSKYLVPCRDTQSILYHALWC
jgi:hypothetical protein